MKSHFEKMMVRAFLGLALLMAIASGGSMDLDNAKAVEADYMERVCDGVHRDYKRRGVSCDY